MPSYTAAYKCPNTAKSNKDIWTSDLTLETHISHWLMELGQGPGSVKELNSLVEGTHRAAEIK